jgi:hypothetical protein
MKLNIGYDNKTIKVVWTTKFSDLQIDNNLNCKAHNEGTEQNLEVIVDCCSLIGYYVLLFHVASYCSIFIQQLTLPSANTVILLFLLFITYTHFSQFDHPQYVYSSVWYIWFTFDIDVYETETNTGYLFLLHA